jgi:hypothetical protein
MVALELDTVGVVHGRAIHHFAQSSIARSAVSAEGRTADPNCPS